MDKSKYVSSLMVAALFGAGSFGLYESFASGSHSSHSLHSASTGSTTGAIPTESGQAGFAAIAEIVEIMINDPDTDWSLVNMDALRAHLVDMDLLTTDAIVKMETDGEITAFSVTGTERTFEAAERMVPAHSAELTNNLGWDISTEIDDAVVTMIVKPTTDVPINKIRGLGFFGIMATGAHHQPHHLGMAKGTMVH